MTQLEEFFKQMAEQQMNYEPVYPLRNFVFQNDVGSSSTANFTENNDLINKYCGKLEEMYQKA